MRSIVGQKREQKLQRVAGRVWVYPHDPDPDAIGAAVGVVADERGSVLIDAGNSPAHARKVRRAIEEAGRPAPRWLVYTHHHWDHTWGASAWDGVEVVAHASADRLAGHDFRGHAGAADRSPVAVRRRQPRADSIVALDPESDVMLLGDCYFPPPFHLRTEADTTDFAMARRLLRERHAYYVDSHSAPRAGQSAATPSG
jgi:glyoxylase-like metal-dependent hydrolase (beta-lactamase superfamily II)